MPLPTFQKILSQIGSRSLYDIRPFYSGDPLLEKRMPKILQMIKDYCHARTTIYTNGAFLDGRRILLDPNLDEVHFTISAATPETYARVHGRPFFSNAVGTVRWLENRRREALRILIHFVIVDDNFHEIEEWKQLFEGFEQVISPIVKNQDLQVSEKYNTHSIQEQHERGTFKGDMGGMPCVLYNNLTIDWMGRYLQCCTFYDPSHWNYGTVHEKTVDEAWAERQANRLHNPICDSCNLKNKNYRSIIADLEMKALFR